MPETGLDRDWPQWTQRIYHAMAPVLVRILPGTRSVAGSGSDLAWLTASPDVADVTGTYFSGRRRRESSPQSHDAARAAELWDVSEELVAEH